MKEETRKNFEMAHHHNLWKSKDKLSTDDLINCLAEAIRQHAFISTVAQCEALDECVDDLELIVTAMHAHREGSLGLSNREEVDMPLLGLFNSATDKINLRRG